MDVADLTAEILEPLIGSEFIAATDHGPVAMSLLKVDDKGPDRPDRAFSV